MLRLRAPRRFVLFLTLLAMTAIAFLYISVTYLTLDGIKTLCFPSNLKVSHVGDDPVSSNLKVSHVGDDPVPSNLKVSHVGDDPVSSNLKVSHFTRVDSPEDVPAPSTSSCPSVLSAMRQGRWHQSITDEQRREMARIIIKLKNTKSLTALPFYLQRNDSRCGNVTAPGPIYRPPKKFDIERYNRWPATCRPDGSTPCCRDNVCVNRSVEDCACPNCTDLRSLVFAEYATWRPADERCTFPAMSQKELCSLLEGRTLVMVGDSLTRHFYAAFLMQLRGDEQDGAFPSNGGAPKVRERCRGVAMFLVDGCTGNIDNIASLCDGRARARYISFYHPTQGISVQKMIEQVTDELTRSKDRGSIALVGIGSHYKVHGKDGYTIDAEWALKDSVLPMLEQLSAAGVPISSKLLWMTINAKMNFKEPEVKEEFKAMITRFNEAMEKVMRAWKVPVFDTYNMTADRVLALDFAHYGLGLQRVKVHMLFQYLRELGRKGLW